MNRIITFVFSLLITIMSQAQELKIDKELKNFVDAVVLLRQNNNGKINSSKSVLKNSKTWTLMDELKDENSNECWLTKKMKRFNLVPILTEVLTDRYGKNISRGDFLNGEDPRFDYSLIEKGIKAKKKVRYTFQGRVGKQDFVIIWKETAPDDLKGTPLVLEERKLRKLKTDDDRELIDEAHKEANRITLWEKITHSNHKDVTYYKGLLQEYTQDLLMVMRHDFLEEVTNRHIKNKAFEDD